MASMIGIGVAVDYSLFVVSRYRRELNAGAPSDEALRRALASSGTAVVFSGATGAGSLAGPVVIDREPGPPQGVRGVRLLSHGRLATPGPPPAPPRPRGEGVPPPRPPP